MQEQEQRCAACGACWPPGSKFCRTCGGRLERVVPEGELRQTLAGLGDALDGAELARVRAVGRQLDALAPQTEAGPLEDVRRGLLARASGLEDALAAAAADGVRRKNRRALIVFAALAGPLLLWFLAHQRIRVDTDTQATVTITGRGDPWTHTGSTAESPHYLLGQRTIRVERAGFVPITDRVVVSFGRGTVERAYELVPAFGALAAASSVDGASITVKGEFDDRTEAMPARLQGLRAGPLDVVVELPGHTPWRRQIEVPSNDVLDLGSVAWVGDLKLDGGLVGRPVQVDGRDVGQTPLTLKDLPARRARVRVDGGAEGDWIAHVDVPPGSLVEPEIRLSKTATIRLQTDADPTWILLDNQEQPAGRRTLEGLAPGGHHLLVTGRVEGLGQTETFETRVDLAPGEILDLGVIRFTGWLTVDSEPSGARVLWGGTEVGRTPFEGRVASATSQLQVVSEDGAASQQVTVPRGASVDVGVVRLESVSSAARVSGMSSHASRDLVIHDIELRANGRRVPLVVLSHDERNSNARRDQDGAESFDGRTSTANRWDTRMGHEFVLARADHMAFAVDEIRVWLETGSKYAVEKELSYVRVELSRDGKAWTLALSKSLDKPSRSGWVSFPTD